MASLADTNSDTAAPDTVATFLQSVSGHVSPKREKEDCGTVATERAPRKRKSPVVFDPTIAPKVKMLPSEESEERSTRSSSKKLEQKNNVDLLSSPKENNVELRSSPNPIRHIQGSVSVDDDDSSYGTDSDTCARTTSIESLFNKKAAKKAADQPVAEFTVLNKSVQGKGVAVATPKRGPQLPVILHITATATANVKEGQPVVVRISKNCGDPASPYRMAVLKPNSSVPARLIRENQQQKPASSDASAVNDHRAEVNPNVPTRMIRLCAPVSEEKRKPPADLRVNPNPNVRRISLSTIRQEHQKPAADLQNRPNPSPSVPTRIIRLRAGNDEKQKPPGDAVNDLRVRPNPNVSLVRLSTINQAHQKPAADIQVKPDPSVPTRLISADNEAQQIQNPAAEASAINDLGVRVGRIESVLSNDALLNDLRVRVERIESILRNNGMLH